MENSTEYTSGQSSKVVIYILIGVAIVALVWLVNKNSSEKFSNEENKSETLRKLKPEYQNLSRQVLRKIKPNDMNSRYSSYRTENESSYNNNSKLNEEDIDERVREKAIMAHKLQLMEQKEEKIKTEQPLPYMPEMKESSHMHLTPNTRDLELEDSPLVKFAKDTQNIVDKYRPNDLYKKRPNNNGSYYELTGDDRTIALMNEVDRNQNINDVACNLSNSLSDNDKKMISDYKNKYYNMYSHQINCDNGNGNMTGCAKKCYSNGMSPSLCKTQDCVDSLNELNNGADFVSLNQLILDKNNSRSCSTCTQGPILSRAVGVQNILDQVTNLDNVSMSFMDSQLLDQDNSNVQSKENFSTISRELMKKDKELVKKKKVSFANVNNFANFNNYIAQNGVLETSVDKMAEVRSNVTNNATCELNKYGQSISEVYDNLMNNPYMQYKKSCDTNKITGILEDKINNYDGNGNFGGNYGGDYAQI